MSWSWLSWAYTFSLTVGTAYTVIAFFMGHHGGGHDGGHDGGHGDGGDGGDHSMHFPLFSPIAIAIFMTAFGAGGMIGLEMLKNRHPAMSLAVALGAGLVFAFTIASAMAFVFRKTVSTSVARESDVIGVEAVVVVTIPANGVGKISYDAAGSKYTATARSMAGTEIRQDARVVVREREGNALVVVPK